MADCLGRLEYIRLSFLILSWTVLDFYWISCQLNPKRFCGPHSKTLEGAEKVECCICRYGYRSIRIFLGQTISYIKMKVCMYVCVYVRRPAARPTQAITPKFGMGSSFHPGSAPSQEATTNVGPQGYLPYWPHLKFLEGLRIGRGPANKSYSSGWVCLIKFYLQGANSSLEPTGSTLPNGGVCFENWAGASKQKLLLGVGL